MAQLTPQESINLLDKYLSGEISDKDFFQRIPSKLELGENYLQSQQGWSRFFQRSGRRIIGIPKGIAEAAQGGFGAERLVDLWNQHGSAAPAVWAYEIGRGSTLGVAELAWELMLGHGDIGDAVEVAASVAPFGRVANTARATKYVNTIRKADPAARAKIFAEGYQKTIQEISRRQAAGDTTPVPFQRYRVKDLELTQQEFEYLKSVGAIDRALNYGETAAEVAEILFNPEELIDTVAFSGIMRGINRIMQQDPSQFQDQVGVPQDGSQGPVPAVAPQPGIQTAPLPPHLLGVEPPPEQPQQQPQPAGAFPGTTTQQGQTVVTPAPGTTALPAPGQTTPLGQPTPDEQALALAGVQPPGTPPQQPVGALPPGATPLPEHAGTTELDNARRRAATEHAALIDATVERIVNQVDPQRQRAIGVTPAQPPTPEQQALALAGVSPEAATGVTPPQQPAGALPEPPIVTPPQGQDIESLRRQLIDHIAGQIMSQVAPENITTDGFTPTEVPPAGGSPPPAPAGAGGGIPPIGQLPPASQTLPAPGQVTPVSGQPDPISAGVIPGGTAPDPNPDWMTHRPAGDPNAPPDPTRVTPPPPPAVDALATQIANELYDSGSMDVQAFVEAWDADPRPDGYGDSIGMNTINERVLNIDENIFSAIRDEYYPEMSDADAGAQISGAVADKIIQRWQTENPAPQPTPPPTPDPDPQQTIEEQLEYETPGLLEGTTSQLEFTLGSVARNTNNTPDVSAGLGAVILKYMRNALLFNREVINTIGRRFNPDEFQAPGLRKIEKRRLSEFLNRNFIVDFVKVDQNGEASYVIKTDSTEAEINIRVTPINDQILVSFSRDAFGGTEGFLREYVFANEPGNQYLNKKTNQIVPSKDARSIALDKALRIFGDTLGTNLREDLFTATNFGALSAVKVESYLDLDHSNRGHFVTVANPDLIVQVEQEGENLFRVVLKKESDGTLVYSNSNVSIHPTDLAEWQRTSQNAGRNRLDKRHIYTLAAETALRDHYGEPHTTRKVKGVREYHYDYNGETYRVKIEAPHGNKTRDVTIHRHGYKPQTVTIEASSYDKAAFYAVPLIDSDWKPLQVAATPSVAQNPDIGRVIQIPTLSGELEYYWQNPDNPEDVILVELELVRENTVEEARKGVQDRIIGRAGASAELVNKLNEFITDLGASVETAQELQELLIRDFGATAGKARWRDVQALKAAMRGQTQVYSAKVTRDGFHEIGFPALYFNPLTENWQSRLERTIPETEFYPRPDFVRPKTSPIAKAKNLLVDVVDNSMEILRKSYALVEKATPFQAAPSVEVDLLDEEFLVAGETIRKELLGQIQSIENGKRVNIIGRIVTSMHELMAITQLTRDGRNETSYAVYVDKNGVVISQDVFSTGSIGSVAHEGDYVGRIVEKINNNPDIAKVYMIHNHPSGNSTPSSADIHVAAKIHGGMKAAGLEDRWGGLSSHDSGRYSVTIDPEHYALNVELSPEERGWEEDPLWTPAISDNRAKKLVGKHLNTVFDEIKNFRSDEGKITFILTDFPHRASVSQADMDGRQDAQVIMGMFTLTDLDKLDGSDSAVLEGIERVMLQSFRTHGGINVIGIFDDENIDNEIMHHIQQRFNVDFFTSLDAKSKRVDSTSNVTSLDRIDRYFPSRSNTEAAVDLHIEEELRSTENRWFEKFDNLTLRRLVDPRNGFSPQGLIDAFKENYERLEREIKTLPARFDKWHPVRALKKARLANIKPEDVVLVVGNNEADAVFSAMRNGKDKGVELSNQVSTHSPSKNIADYDGETPHVIIMDDVLSHFALDAALDLLAENGRLVAHISEDADTNLLDALGSNSANITSRLSGYKFFSDYNFVGNLSAIRNGGGYYIIIDKEPRPSDHKATQASVDYGGVKDIEDARNGRLSIDYRSDEQLAMVKETGASAAQQTLREPVGERSRTRGIGEPRENVYVATAAPGSAIDYLFEQDPDAPLEDTGGAGNVPALPAPAPETGGGTVSDPFAEAGNVGGAFGVSPETGSPEAALLEQSIGNPQGAIQQGSLPVGQSGFGVDSGLQREGDISDSDISFIREERRSNAARFTASAGTQARSTTQDTPFGTETVYQGGDTHQSLNDSDIGITLRETDPNAQDPIYEQMVQDTDPRPRFRLRERLGEIFGRFSGSTLPYQTIQTGKRALYKMGAVGKEILRNIEDTEYSANRLTGEFDLLLEIVKNEANDLFIAEIKQHGAEWVEGQFVDAMQRTREVHPEIQKFVDEEIRPFIDENFTQPMLDMNHDILSAGIIGDLPVDWVNGSGRDLLLRRADRPKGWARELPLFSKFLKDTSNIHKFVFDNEGQHIYAIVQDTETVKRKGGYQTRQVYKLVGAMGDEVTNIDPNKLPDKYEDKAFIENGNWQGDMEGVERVWDAEVKNTPSEAFISEEFERLGLDLPEGFRFRYRKFGDLDEWHVNDKDGNEVYRLRYLGNNKDGDITTHADYDDFRDRLIVYEPNPRDPIMIYKGQEASHLWEPLSDYYPHMIPWRDFNFEATNMDNKSLQYAVEFYEANKDTIDSLQQATEILRREQVRVKSRKYGHLEQARIYNYPSYNKKFFDVLQAFGNRAAERQHIIKNFGQNSDLFQGMLNKLISPMHLRSEMSDRLQAIMRLRYAVGYRDFTINRFAKRTGNAFMPEGEPAILDPDGDPFRRMTVDDWKVLADAGIIEGLSDGGYRVNPAFLPELENPSISDAALKKGFVNYSIAADAFANQYGVPTMSVFEEDLNNVSRSIREGVGLLFLGKAWTSQIGQSANTIALTGLQNTLRGVAGSYTRDARAYAREIGATLVDATQWHSSDTSMTSALLAPRTDFHWKGTGLRQWIKNRLATPFMHFEKINRTIAAGAGKHYAMHHLKMLVENPQDTVARTHLETLTPFGDHLTEQLERVLRTTVRSEGGRRVTADDIEWVMNTSPDMIEQNRPELIHVRDYINNIAKTVSDIGQHRLTPIDRIQLLNSNPIMKAAFSLNSFNIKQTEFIKNVIVREARLMKSYQDAGQGWTGLARGVGARSMTFLPKLTGTIGFGMTAIIMGHMIRFRGFDEDDLTIAAALYQVGLGGYLANTYQSAKYYRGLHQMALGPGFSTILDAATDPLGTAGRLSLPVGPTFRNYFGGDQ